MKAGLFVVILFLCLSAQAADYEKDIGAFFELLKKGKYIEAVDAIYSSNPYVSSIPDAIKNVKTQISGLPGLVGEINTIENIGTYKVGESLVQITYIVTYDRQPVRFEFQYFKVSTGWRINSFSFDDEVFNTVSKAAREKSVSQ